MAQHQVDTAKFAGRVIVRAAGETLADSQDAVVLHESGYDPVYYIPRPDVRMELMKPTDHTTGCPHKALSSKRTKGKEAQSEGCDPSPLASPPDDGQCLGYGTPECAHRCAILYSLRRPQATDSALVGAAPGG